MPEETQGLKLPPPHFIFGCGCVAWLCSCYEGRVSPTDVIPDLSLVDDMASSIEMSMQPCAMHDVQHGDGVEDGEFSACTCPACEVSRQSPDHNWRGLRTLIEQIMRDTGGRYG